MLDALDETIKAVLRELGGLDPDEVDIAFDAPDREWAARVGKPTVNCYLYDIRENLDLRSTEWTVERQSNGKAVTKQAPRRFDLSYVCTAWTADVEDEHRLLWRVLATMIRCPELPRHLLQGSLAQVEWPVITEVAQPDGLLRDPADVWSALDNRIRPSVNVVVTLPLADSDPREAPMVLTRRLRFDENGHTQEFIQIAGTVTGEDGKPLPDVVVRVRDHAYATVSSPHGRFWLSGLPAGTYTLVAEAGTTTVRREVNVPGTEYDIVVAGGSEPEPEVKKAGRAATRPKRSR
ncbi:MAG TPA: Pvc16 family protein [Thermomicrobiales bacterium]|jgi:hypothetical protein